MIVAPLTGLALLISIAASPSIDPTSPPVNLSTQEKNAAMQPIVRSATDCIARTVAGDPRFHEQDLGDLIVDSINACLGSVRAMIDGYDRYFGAGTGEAFFMGPYLDALPAMVVKTTAEAPPQSR
jgi:hypothetical protein